MVFRSLQPPALRVELKVDVHRHKRKRRVRQRELRIALDGTRQVFGGNRQRGRLIAEALSQAGHERVVRLGIAAVPIARRGGAWKAPVQ